MQKSSKKSNRRKKNLILLCAFTAIMLTVSTYAWFIGMRTVNVATFEVNIASTKSLLLSIDGENWTDTLTINGDNYKTAAYENNTNSWEKLIPVSTVGEMDKTSSRLKLYEKSSMTTTPGGYRLMAYPVQNTGANEVKGYVAFDLFIKNFTGSKYYVDLDPANEEAIYLTTNSKVGVAAAGVAGTGIENSVRVAFAQIGRVIGTSTDASLITGINCTGTDESVTDENKAVTGICREATIWEPNDLAHVQNAINWYETSCKTRKADGTDVTKIASFNTDTACSGVTDGKYAVTYAVKQEIKESDNVDVYDGEAYNTYTVSTAEGEKQLLKEMDYFTDSEKSLTGANRPTFMTLAPNSITKVRVYIYIEGQDIDNYDFASIGKMISVNFGFTKERIEPEDIDYEGTFYENCEGGEVPTTEEACAAAFGTWHSNEEGTSGTCSGHTKAYCDAIGGTYSTTTPLTGLCVTEAGDNRYADQEACEEANGEWDGAACRITQEACNAQGEGYFWNGN